MNKNKDRMSVMMVACMLAASALGLGPVAAAQTDVRENQGSATSLDNRGVASSAEDGSTERKSLAGKSIEPKSREAASKTAKPSKVYRCELAGRIVYSDHACDKAKDKTEFVGPTLGTYGVSDERATKRTGAMKAKSTDLDKKNSERDRSPTSHRSKDKCQAIELKLETNRVRLGQGHSGDAGEKLNEERRKLEKQRATEHCR